MDNSSFDDNLLARYLIGECSAAEVETVERWIAQDPAHRDEVESMACAWDVAAGLPSAKAVARMWSGIAPELDVSARNADHRTPASPAASRFRLVLTTPTNQRRWMKLAAAAAVLVVAAGGAIVAWQLRSANQGSAVFVTRQNADAQEFRTPRGQRGTMTLLDGTRVTMGPDSRLWVRVGSAGPREAVLDGEAVFTVVHDAARPFRVQTRSTVTEDLGTTFGVRSYPDEPVRVVVREGAVAVRDTAHDRVIVLAPRDLAEVSQDGRVAVQRGTDPDTYLAWTTGRLVFRHAPLADVAKQLERWYNVRIVVDDPTLLRTSVNAAFDDDLDEVLSVLTAALGVRAERHARWVYLRSRG